MRRCFTLGLLLAALAVSGVSQNTQQGPSDNANDQMEQAPPIRVFVEEVRVPFVVTDSKNRIITDLTKDDFQVFENKVPQTISGFTRETDVPLRIGLLIDTSNSIRDRLGFEQKAAADFLTAMIRPGRDKALLGSFDSMAELLQDFTDDREKLTNAVQLLRAGGGTALYDAIYYACRDRLMQEAPPATDYRRALVVLSDGEDNQSRFSRAQALEMARRAEVMIYTISTNIRGISMPGDKVLQEFSQETGGRFLQPSSWEDLDEAFETVSNELRSQFALSFRPTTPRDGKFHEIEITLRQKKGLRVRARRGYFATKTPTAETSAVQ